MMTAQNKNKLKETKCGTDLKVGDRSLGKKD
jgi:hypothetical protein